jgi:hypothetical protein
MTQALLIQRKSYGFSASVRLPLVDPDEKTAAAIREALKGYQIDLPHWS